METLGRERPERRVRRQPITHRLFGGRRLLLVEDNEANRMVAWEILTRAGFRVDVAENGREAVGAAGRDDYSVILMDLQMPEMTDWRRPGRSEKTKATGAMSRSSP